MLLLDTSALIGLERELAEREVGPVRAFLGRNKGEGRCKGGGAQGASVKTAHREWRKLGGGRSEASGVAKITRVGEDERRGKSQSGRRSREKPAEGLGDGA